MPKGRGSNERRRNRRLAKTGRTYRPHISDSSRQMGGRSYRLMYRKSTPYTRFLDWIRQLLWRKRV